MMNREGVVCESQQFSWKVFKGSVSLSVFLPRIYIIVLEKKFLPEKVRVLGNPSRDTSERRVMTCKD